MSMSGAFKSLITSGLGDALKEKTAEARTALRIGGVGVNTTGGLHVEVAALREKVKALEESGAQGYLMNPDDIHLSRYANRHEMSFLSQDFKDLCAEIQSTGGNVQPIGVVKQENGRMELVFGHRRRRACKKLGLKVRVIEIPGPIAPAVLMKYMHAENAARTDLTVFEQGCWYHEALQDKVYPTAAELAQDFGITEAWVSKALQVARLPEDVIRAFPNPLEITSKMGEELAKALKADEDAVLYRALELQEPREDGKPYSAQEVFLRLLYEGGVTRAEKPRPMKLADKAKPYGKINRDAKGRIQMVLAEDFNRDEMKKIEAFVQELAKGKKSFLPPEPKVKKNPVKTAQSKKAD